MVHTRTQREIEKISKSCQIVADTLIMLEKYIAPGIPVSELDRMAEEFILSRGARPAFKGYMGYPATLCVSIDDAVVHGIPGKKILENGQIVGIDCGAELNGYYGDHARTFAVGEVNAEKEKLMAVTFESLNRAIEQAVPGNHVGDIGYAVQSTQKVMVFQWFGSWLVTGLELHYMRNHKSQILDRKSKVIYYTRVCALQLNQ